MGKRKRIGIVYSVNKNWIGGTYYIQNLISALNILPDIDRPDIDVYTETADNVRQLKEITDYQYLHHAYPYIWWRLKVRGLLRRLHLLEHLNWRVENSCRNDLFVFPVFGSHQGRGLTWIPDFQHERLPDFFDEEEIHSRRKQIRIGNELGFPVVLSSQDSLNDYLKYFPDCHTRNFVMHFAVTLPDFSHVAISELKKKYGIGKKYYFCANQFWAHKNHLFLFSEFREYLKKNADVDLICTGALSDYRNDDYINRVKETVSQKPLASHVKILGFIPRHEMLCLMKHAEAVIQPSLFEGWSTVVEDAKAMSQFVFLSDLPVHREQMTSNVCFFNPRQQGDLTQKLLSTEIATKPYDYERDRHDFAASFLNIIKEIS